MKQKQNAGRSVYTFTADAKAQHKSVKKYLKQSEGFSSRFVTAISKANGLFVNGKAVFSCYELREGDKIELILPQEHTHLEPSPIALDILYEDEDILAVAKPPYMVVHPTPSHPNDTLANAIAYHFLKQNIPAKPHFINRLDMNTSGVVIVGKNRHAHHFIQTQSQQGHLQKVYAALCHGKPPQKQGLICANIGRKEEGSIYRVVRPDGKESKTLYEVLDEHDGFSLMRLQLLTGRTHQIRVHLNYLHTPVIADDLYYPHYTALIARQALHAYACTLTHPKTKRTVCFKAPLPEDFRQAMQKLGLNDAQLYQEELNHADFFKQ